MLKFEFLNERSDRTIEIHGTDTCLAQSITTKIRKFAVRLTETKKPQFMMSMSDPDNLHPYGQCFHNVDNLMCTKGGSMLKGWYIYEGKHIIEAEAHCLWVSPFNTTVALDVTKHQSGKPQSGLFVIDEKSFSGGTHPNVVFWK